LVKSAKVDYQYRTGLTIMSTPYLSACVDNKPKLWRFFGTQCRSPLYTLSSRQRDELRWRL